MKKGISEKCMSGFMNIPLLIFEKGDKQKNCVRVCKYTFLIFKKRGICKYTF